MITVCKGQSKLKNSGSQTVVRVQWWYLGFLERYSGLSAITLYSFQFEMVYFYALVMHLS